MTVPDELHQQCKQGADLSERQGVVLTAAQLCDMVPLQAGRHSRRHHRLLRECATKCSPGALQAGLHVGTLQNAAQTFQNTSHAQHVSLDCHTVTSRKCSACARTGMQE